MEKLTRAHEDHKGYLLSYKATKDDETLLSEEDKTFLLNLWRSINENSTADLLFFYAERARLIEQANDKIPYSKATIDGLNAYIGYQNDITIPEQEAKMMQAELEKRTRDAMKRAIFAPPESLRGLEVGKIDDLQ
jgi:hypothetical protein